MIPPLMPRSWKPLAIAAGICFSAAATQAQIATLARDLRTAEDPGRGASFGQLLPFGEQLLFDVRPSFEERQLWISDGSPLGTHVVPAPCPGFCASGSRIVTRDSGKYFFVGASPTGLYALWAGDASGAAPQPLSPPDVDVQRFPFLEPLGRRRVLASGRDDAHGEEPWGSDGTPEGTRLLADLVPGPQGSGPRQFFALPTRTVFLANLGVDETTLFATDGSPEGTTALLALGNRSLRIDAMAVAAGQLYFFLDASGLPELWVTDGTAAGTRRVRQWRDLGVFLFDNVVAVDGELAFVISTDELGAELWVTNGTAAGTRRITDLPLPLPFDNAPASLEIEKLGARYVFLAKTPTSGLELWATDGNPASTEDLLDSCGPGCAPATSPGLLVRRGERAFFASRHPLYGDELWVTDGTAAGTRLFAETCSGACGEVRRIAEVGGDLYWLAREDDLGFELWRLGEAGVRQVTDFAPRSPFEVHAPFRPWIAPLADGVAFGADDGLHGGQLWWATNRAPPVMLTAIDAGTAGADPSEVVDVAGTAVFHACTGRTTRALWGSRGSANDTVPLTAADAFGDCDGVLYTSLGKAGPRAFFVPDFATAPPALWTTDGTPEGTREVVALAEGAAPGAPANFAELDSLAYFFQEYADRGELWRSDGTAAGTFAAVALAEPRILSLHFLQAVEGRLYFLARTNTGASEAGLEIWTSDGTAAGTHSLAAAAGGVPLDPRFTAAGGWVYFRGASAANDFEPWKTDGTPEGTERVADLLPGSEGSVPSGLTGFGGSLYFFAHSSAEEWGLWRTDGTAAGTRLVRLFAPRPFDIGFEAMQPVVLGERLLFAADDGASGLELWSVDGTAAGAEPVADLFPGFGGSLPEELTVAGGRVYFTAGEPLHGRELWATDGTGEGTALVHDMMPGPGGSDPRGLAVAGTRLYFSADDGVSGRELWSLDLAGDPGRCPPSETGLCVQDDRFRVEIAWRTPQGLSGSGQPVALTEDTGYFWFFNPANVESIVKVLDGRGVNGHFWTFYGALSNVEYTMTVTDAQTGLTQRYFNPQGQLASVGDTESFGPLGASLESYTAPAESLAVSFEPRVESLFDRSLAGACAPASNRLCLNGGRFAVESTWRDFAGNTGAGTAVPLTADTGYFWFFRDTNVEVVLKVLDGRPVNEKFWVFYGALSNVEYTLTVTDTETGAVKTYFNPARQFASVADTAAF